MFIYCIFSYFAASFAVLTGVIFSYFLIHFDAEFSYVSFWIQQNHSALAYSF